MAAWKDGVCWPSNSDWRMRKLIRANLEAMGLEVQEAVSEQHGLAVARRERPDLILLDLDLADSDAVHLLAYIRTAVRGNSRCPSWSCLQSRQPALMASETLLAICRNHLPFRLCWNRFAGRWIDSARSRRLSDLSCEALIEEP